MNSPLLLLASLGVTVVSKMPKFSVSRILPSFYRLRERGKCEIQLEDEIERAKVCGVKLGVNSVKLGNENVLTLHCVTVSVTTHFNSVLENPSQLHLRVQSQ